MRLFFWIPFVCLIVTTGVSAQGLMFQQGVFVPGGELADFNSGTGPFVSLSYLAHGSREENVLSGIRLSYWGSASHPNDVRVYELTAFAVIPVVRFDRHLVGPAIGAGISHFSSQNKVPHLVGQLTSKYANQFTGTGAHVGITGIWEEIVVEANYFFRKTVRLDRSFTYGGLQLSAGFIMVP